MNFGLPLEAAELIGNALQEQIGLTLKTMDAEVDSSIVPEEEGDKTS
jgi:hypothetical protein